MKAEQEQLISIVIDLSVFVIGAIVLLIIGKPAGLVIVVPLGIWQAYRLISQYMKLKKRRQGTEPPHDAGSK